MEKEKETAQEIQAPVRLNLSDSEIIEIKSEIFSILSKNNLSIKQAKEILESIMFCDFNNLRPWNQSIIKKSNVELI